MKKRRYTAALLPAGLVTALPAAAQSYDGMRGMWDSHFGWGHMLLGGLMMVLVLGALIGLVSVLVRGLGGNSPAPPARDRERGHSARDILDERYAKGEIDRDEYQQRREDLAR